jgi:hypothetical protein
MPQLSGCTSKLVAMNTLLERSRLGHRRLWQVAAVLEADPTGRPLTVKLPGGWIAHYMRRPDDCMTAAVATLMNVAFPQTDRRSFEGIASSRPA